MPNRRTGAPLPWLVTLVLPSACASITAPPGTPTTTPAEVYLRVPLANRTSSHPDPSTVVCVLRSASGRPLTVQARR